MRLIAVAWALHCAANLVIAFSWALVSCSASAGRFLLLEHEEVRGQSRLCTYEDAIGAYAVTVRSGEACPPYVELDE